LARELLASVSTPSRYDSVFTVRQTNNVALQHIDTAFISKFVKHVRSESGKPKMFAVGEFWKDSVGDLEKYLDSLGTQFSVFDAPLHFNFKNAADGGADYDLRAIWDNTVVKQRPIDAV
jgi:alpha-amylase